MNAEDNWAADLAVGWRISERLAKYNRLLEIAENTNWQFANWPNRS